MFSLKLFFNLWLITCCQIYASVRFEFHHFQPTSIVFNENMRPQNKTKLSANILTRQSHNMFCLSQYTCCKYIHHSCTHFSILSRSKQIAIQTYGMYFDTFSTVNLHIKNIFHTKQRDVLIFASMHLRTLLSTKYIQIYKLEPHQRDSFRSTEISSLGK